MVQRSRHKLTKSRKTLLLWSFYGLLIGSGCSPAPVPEAPKSITPGDKSNRHKPAARETTSPIKPKPVPTPTVSTTPLTTAKGVLLADDRIESISSTPLAGPKLESLPLGKVGGPTGGGAAEWRAYAEASLKKGNYAEASRAFAQEARVYEKVGDKNAARVEQLKAARYDSQLEIYQRVEGPAQGTSQERLEPTSGCYVGAFIDRDDRLATHAFASQTFGDIDHFDSLTEKKHASFFTYLRYGNPFPTKWAEYVKQHDAILHLAWEPGPLDDVKDDEYLQSFISALKAYDHPVFLRFAGEMNGAWTPYHSDPKRYKEAFRLVYRLTRSCPKVALLWCPNSVPVDNINEYYPGDDGCDWVGVNLYSVLYIDNNPKTPGDWINPIDLLAPVYNLYARRKPIAIGEYAASHRAECVPKDNVAFAQIKIGQLYSSLPTLFPRVKMVNWYDCNNLVKARPGRQLNNYQLTDSPQVLDTYDAHVNNGYYLGPQEAARWHAKHLESKLVLRNSQALKLQFFARAYIADPIIYLKIDGHLRWKGRLPGQPACNIGTLPPGRHTVEAILADPDNKVLQSKRLVVTVS